MNSPIHTDRKIHKISSRNNAYQHLEVVKRNRSKRTKFGEMVVEGVMPINLCISNGIVIKQVLFSDRGSLSQWAKRLIGGQPQAEIYSVAPQLMAEITDKDEDPEIIVLAAQPDHSIRQLQLDRILILDRPANPGNFGATVRTCNAFGIDAVFLSGHGIDPFDAKSIAASRGTVFSLPIIKLKSNAELETILAIKNQDPRFSVYGSSAQDGTESGTIVPPDRFALVIGNETTGMTPFLKGLADTMLRIPIVGDASSLNAACAASILLYELTTP